MALQIRKTFPEQVNKNTKAVKNKTYLDWIRTLPCVVSGRTPVDAAHINYASLEMGAPGRGKSQKASDRFSLPLHRSEHDAQHDMNEEEYWKTKGINPHVLACVLYGLWNERGEDATVLATAVIQMHRYPGNYTR